MGEALAAGFAGLGGASFLLALIGAVTRLAFGEWAATNDASRNRIIIIFLNCLWNVRPLGEAEAGEKCAVDKRADRLVTLFGALLEQI